MSRGWKEFSGKITIWLVFFLGGRNNSQILIVTMVWVEKSILMQYKCNSQQWRDKRKSRMIFKDRVYDWKMLTAEKRDSSYGLSYPFSSFLEET